MEYKPILFNTEMVRAILEGRKTQTRRIVKAKGWTVNGVPKWKEKDDPEYWFTVSNDKQATVISICPPCAPGDILWVRETWCNLPVSPGGHTRLMRGRYYYKADVPDIRPEGWRGNWEPSIHMPKQAARIFLQVKNVSCQQLWKITANNCIKEGIDIKAASLPDSIGMEKAKALYVEIATKFGTLWNSTIKKADLPNYGWDANPWVWVIEFERIEGKPAGFYADRDAGEYINQDVFTPAI